LLVPNSVEQPLPTGPRYTLYKVAPTFVHPSEPLVGTFVAPSTGKGLFGADVGQPTVVIATAELLPVFGSDVVAVADALLVTEVTPFEML
jgi:hypothetical protein